MILPALLFAVRRMTKSAKSWNKIGDFVGQSRRFCQTVVDFLFFGRESVRSACGFLMTSTDLLFDVSDLINSL